MADADTEEQDMEIYILKNSSGMAAHLSDYGATLVKLLVPSRDGELIDVVLGYDDKDAYEAGTMSMGGIIGRVANRIGGAAFELDGTVYDLTANDSKNTLHGGRDFYNKRSWEAEAVTESSVKFHLNSADMDQGFPGNLSINVTYSLTEDNELKISYEAVTDKDTVFSPTNHSYFNLNGGGDARNHIVWINADSITAVNEDLIPSGDLLEVKGSDYDFTVPKAVISARNGDYDHNYVISGQDFRKAASAYSDKSGIEMTVWTDMPCMQFYTSANLDGIGKNSEKYDPYSALCFETQFAPDAVNHKNFEQPVLKAGERFSSQTVYAFGF